MTDVYELAVDYVIIGILKSPGKATIRNLKSPRKWDEAQGLGFSGATLRFMGNALGSFDLEDFQLWTPEHWIDWAAFKPLVAKAPPGQRPKALGIYHPTLADAGIQSVVVLDETGWEHDEHGNSRKVISLKEFRAPMLAFGKPNPAIPAATQAAPTAQDAADVIIQGQVEQLKRLAG